jgi:glycosyltransferase involved in cell wall biosynthesis
METMCAANEQEQLDESLRGEATAIRSVRALEQATMRVLILADSCNPDRASLPVVGYKAALALADVCDVSLATHVRNRESLERTGCGSSEITYIDNEYIAKPMYRLGTLMRGGKSVGWTTAMAMSYLPYIAFEREVWRVFGKRIKSGEFDVVHRLTPMSPTLPSWIAGRGGVPFVLGPLNGGLKWPTQFRSELNREREWLTWLRGIYRLLPYRRRSYRKAACIIAAFRHTKDDLPTWCRDRVVELPEVGVDPEIFRPRVATESDRLAFTFVGRLVPYKCADVAVTAFAQSEVLRRHRLIIVGDGPDRPLIERLVRENNLQDVVELRGWVDQRSVGDVLAASDVFVFPSIRELGAGVVVEAMAASLPSVVVDYGGPGGLINAECGMKVQLGSKESIAAQFRVDLEKLATDSELRGRLGRAARQRVEQHLTWRAKALQTLEVYRWVAGQRPDKPRFEVR